jgi:hypothetical protein
VKNPQALAQLLIISYAEQPIYAYMFIDDFPMLIFNSYVTVNHVTENYQTAFFLMAVHIPADWQKSDPL